MEPAPQLNQSHSSDNASSLTRWAMRELLNTVFKVWLTYLKCTLIKCVLCINLNKVNVQHGSSSLSWLSPLTVPDIWSICHYFWENDSQISSSSRNRLLSFELDFLSFEPFFVKPVKYFHLNCEQILQILHAPRYVSSLMPNDYKHILEILQDSF